MNLKEILNNVVNGAIYAISLIIKSTEKHTKLTQICLKCSDSLSLPIWNCPKENQTKIDLKK
jgi:hypothetical protein